jgi:hypothetical protein
MNDDRPWHNAARHLATNFAGASCVAQPDRIETRSPSSAPKNLPVFRRGAS